MLKIVIPANEKWDDVKNRFVTLGESYTLELEHSLCSLSAWEGRWHKPFLSEDKKTYEETIDYIRCMTLNDVPDVVYDFIPDEAILTIEAYMADGATAMTFVGMGSDDKIFRKKITMSETIYYWMVEYGIPIEFEKWHFNKLITFIRYVRTKREEQESKGKPLTREMLSQRDKLNAQRRKAMRSRG